MSNVPHHSSGRSSHGHGSTSSRSSHRHSGFMPPLLGGDVAAEQWAKDGVVEPGGILPGTVDGGALVPGTVSITEFADTIRPVAIVTALPTLPDPDYPELSYVVLTTDERLYKNIGDVWVKGVDGADIVADSITAGQIAAGAISASEIAAGAVSADKLSVGSRTYQASLVPNHSFEDGVHAGNATGWTPSVSGGGLSYRDATTSGVTDGTAAYVLYSTTGAGNWSRVTSTLFGVAAGEVLFAQVSLYPTHTATGCVYFRVRWYDRDGTFLSESTIVGAGNVSAGVRQTLRGYVTAPTNATQAEVDLWNYQPAGTPTYLVYDQVVVQRASGGVRNSTGNVLIDSTGITINNGNLFINDEWGSSVLGASGFSGTWSDFVRTGLYNGSFEANTANSNAPEGRTVYAPYWNLDKLGGSPIITTGVGTIAWTLPAAGASVRITSDRVRCSEGQEIGVTLAENNSGLANNVTRRTVELIFYSVPTGGSGTAITVAVDDIQQGVGSRVGVTAPVRGGSGFKYVEVRITAAWQSVVSGTPNYGIYDVAIHESNPVAGETQDADSNLTLDTTFTDIPGVTTTVFGGKDYLCIWTVRFDVTAAGVGDCQARLVVNGSAVGPIAILDISTGRASVGAHLVTGATGTFGSSCVIKVQAKKSIAAGTATAIAAHCVLTVVPL